MAKQMIVVCNPIKIETSKTFSLASEVKKDINEAKENIPASFVKA
jgi:hypothetical protein